MAEPISLDELVDCAPGTLGHGDRNFIVDNGLEANLARNYRDFNEHLSSQGTLDRLPANLGYTILRGFQIHDFLHVLTGFSSKPDAILPAMDAMSAGWAMGRAAENLHFTKWEDELNTPLGELRDRVGIDVTRYETF